MNSKEKTVLIFFCACFLIGAGILFFPNQQNKKNLEKITLTMTNSTPTKLDAEDAIEAETKNTNLINLNTASQKELEALSGIGPVLSQRIIEYRKAHNGFKTKEEVLKISGIGPKKYSAIKDKITVK